MPDAQAQMDQIIGSLRSEYTRAMVQVQLTYASDDSAKAAAIGALNMDGTRINHLENDLAPQVNAGTMSFDRWNSIAKTTHDDIAYQSGLTDQWAFSGVIIATIDQTASDVKEDVQRAATAIKDAAPWVGGGLVLGLLAIAAIYITFTFRGVA
jgi:hypothetical protein